MAYSEDHIVLAAEYALGTLDSDERAQVQTMMSVDKEFAAVVEAWEFRLSVLNQMVGLIEPRPELWERIKAAISRPTLQPEPVSPDLPQQSLPSAEAAPVADAAPAIEQIPVLSPLSTDPVAPIDQSPATESAVVSTPVPPLIPQVPVQETAPSFDNLSATRSPVIADAEIKSATAPSNVVQLTSKVRRWRTIASAMTAVAAVLLALLSVQVYRPELVPSVLRPKSADSNIPPAQYVALLQSDGTSPAFILTVDAGSKNFTVRRVGATPEAGKSYELWLVSDTLQKPRSLGVIGGSDFTTRPVLSSYDAETLNRATYAVTVEPEGGSPTGSATGPIVFSGKLIETVPTAPAR